MERHDNQEPGTGMQEGRAGGGITLEELEKKARELREALEAMKSRRARQPQTRQAGRGEEEEQEQEQEQEEAPPTIALYDGSAESASAWKKVGSGSLEPGEKELVLRSGPERGLAYYEPRGFDDFRLRIEYRLRPVEAPMSAAIRFFDPEQPVPDREDPDRKQAYDNPAFVASHTGFEVWLGARQGREAGTLAGIPFGDEPGKQRHGRSAEVKGEDWNDLEIEVRGDDYTVRLNGVETASFTNLDDWRGRAPAGEEGFGYLGIVMGEAKRVAGEPISEGREPARRGAGGLAGPMVPHRRQAREQAPADQGELVIRRIELQEHEAEVRKKKGKEKEKKQKLSARDRAALHEEVLATVERIDAKHRGVKEELRKAYGYAVFPSIGRASLVVGGARGYGEVFEQGKSIGFARVTQLTIGVQVGGQTFSELVRFGSKEALDAFKQSPVVFNANASAAFIRGASGTVDFKGMAAQAFSRGGMLLELSLGGQKFRFLPGGTEAEEEGDKGDVGAKLRSGAGKAGEAAKGLAGKLASKASGLFKSESK